MKKIKKSWMFAGLLVSALIMVQGAYAATLTSSTSLTVVNVTEFKFGSVDVTKWVGAWPQPPVAPNTASDITTPKNQEVYIGKVDFYAHFMEWFPLPYPTPYARFSNGINSLICAVWSEDKGKTFKLQSWDYLVPTTKGKGLEEGMPNCWMGTMIHTVCDRKAGECNGRYRSNLFFEEYPSGTTTCWGSAVMN